MAVLFILAFLRRSSLTCSHAKGLYSAVEPQPVKLISLPIAKELGFLTQHIVEPALHGRKVVP